jgi:hypothetical protein
LHFANLKLELPFFQTESQDQRCTKWWNWGTRFPESKLALRKLFRPRREIVEMTMISLEAIAEYKVRANNSAEN